MNERFMNFFIDTDPAINPLSGKYVLLENDIRIGNNDWNHVQNSTTDNFIYGQLLRRMAT